MTPKMIPPILPGEFFFSFSSSNEPGGVITGVAIDYVA
jgi:hypothetical protein